MSGNRILHASAGLAQCSTQLLAFFFKLLFLSLQCSGYVSALFSLATRFITILTGQTASELRGTFSRLAAFLRA